jgi:beta-N-acetylhexosaminidase
MNLKTAPFFLDDDAVAWVRRTLASLTPEQKLGQLFCLIAYDADEAALRGLTERYCPGGVMFRPMPLSGCLSATRALQESSAVPLLIAANLERGGAGICTDGTTVGSPMQVAACGDLALGRAFAECNAAEGAAAGGNWAFAPIVDLDYNFRNPITNTRTFGSDPETVRDLGVEYGKTVQSMGLAASVKHFPGDGRDERDQHLVPTINDMTCEDWDATYGRVYRACIEAGALTVMAGHILQPAWSKRLNPALRDGDLLPATLSPELLNGLLRGHLGFNGLIVSDATTMAGMTMVMPRSQAVPACIAAGCDMFLFTRNLDEDYGFMRKGLEDGVITPQRLDEALTRILALKAALGLHKNPLIPDETAAKAVLGSAKFKQTARAVADKSITLVKERPGVFPLTPARYKRVLFYPIESAETGWYTVRAGVCDQFRALLEREGFQIDVFDASKGMEGMMRPYADVTDRYDLIVYLANLGTRSNQTAVRIEWAMPMGANVPIYGHTVPTVFISTENPYHLLDVPRGTSFINCYSSTPETLEALVDKLCGRSPFQGRSPSDPFLARWDTRL